MKFTHLSLLALSLFGVSCATSGSRPTKVDLLSLNKAKEIEKLSDVELIYPTSEEIPYVTLGQGFALASFVATEYLGAEQKYTLAVEGNNVVAKDPTGLKATFDLKKQTITVEDYPTFILGKVAGVQPSIAASPVNTDGKCMEMVMEETTYTRGKDAVIDLNAYPHIDLRQDEDGQFMMPFAAFNHIFVNSRAGYVGIGYNHKEAFYADQGLANSSTGTLTKLGQRYFGDAPKRNSVSKEFATFAYEETMFNMDYFYGMKEIKGISSFTEFTTQKGLAADMCSGDLEKMEDAYATMLFKCLEDGHTAFATASPFRNYGDFVIKDSSQSPKELQKAQQNQAMNQKRAELNVDKCYEVIDDTAFLFFDDFEEIDEKALYGNITIEEAEDNNALLFAYAYKEIKKNPAIKNVVVDMVTNNGGDAMGLAYCLGTLLGKFHLDTRNPLTGASAHVVYRTDINVDGKIDENDIPLCNDYNIYMLDSKFAFSCGNLFPVAAKYNNPEKVKCIGDHTGGGTCVIKSNFGALGQSYLTSGPIMLTKKTEQGYVHIEDGAPVDLSISYDKMLDRSFIVSEIHKLNA